MIEHPFFHLDQNISRGIILEFILHEYVRMLGIISRLETSPSEMALKELDKLAISPLQSPLHARAGIIDKLSFYCDLLVQGSELREEIIGSVEEMRKITSLQRSRLKHSISSSSKTPVVSLVSLLQEQLPLFFSYLIPFLEEHSDSEVTIFALLELRDELNAHLGPRTVEQILQNLFPKGPQQMRNMLCSSFEKRGFSEFLIKHETLLEELEWDVLPPCDKKRSS